MEFKISLFFFLSFLLMVPLPNLSIWKSQSYLRINMSKSVIKSFLSSTPKPGILPVFPAHGIGLLNKLLCKLLTRNTFTTTYITNIFPSTYIRNTYTNFSLSSIVWIIASRFYLLKMSWIQLFLFICTVSPTIQGTFISCLGLLSNLISIPSAFVNTIIQSNFHTDTRLIFIKWISCH